ncbi:hypothetical protein [Mangrovihabitans endophyticus]|uniref:Uncharacterized protein n=1 Tax=Mangrovihabitans endophyticus TaxID=1751298 RepID=A0A8J3FRH6_9ACTN|nr:hypothetical protein [Mangrovihabitans endophyticus]GGL16111.1 hypothetical protein GCM10012284_58440 [Mangrovihabitans endophyticus]
MSEDHLTTEMVASLERLRRISDDRQADLQRRPTTASTSDAARREEAADRRQDVLDRRSEAADRRDETQTQREAMLDSRQADLDRRVDLLNERDSED